MSGVIEESLKTVDPDEIAYYVFAKSVIVLFGALRVKG